MSAHLFPGGGGGGKSRQELNEGEGAGGGCAPSCAKRGSFQCTDIFMHEKLMFPHSFRAKSVLPTAL